MSGYVYCACRDCMEIAIEGDEDQGKALCSSCAAAGCSPLGDADCDAPGQYEDECSDEAWPCELCEGGQVVPMGKLGRTEHGRCRACGMDQSRDGGL